MTQKKIKIKKYIKLYQDEPLISILNENIMNVRSISKGKRIKTKYFKNYLLHEGCACDFPCIRLYRSELHSSQ